MTANLLKLLKLVSQYRISQPCVDLCSILLISWHLKSASVEEICQVVIFQRQEIVLDYRSLAYVVTDNISWAYALKRFVDVYTLCNGVNSVLNQMGIWSSPWDSWGLHKIWLNTGNSVYTSWILKSAYISRLLLHMQDVTWHVATAPRPIKFTTIIIWW